MFYLINAEFPAVCDSKAFSVHLNGLITTELITDCTLYQKYFGHSVFMALSESVFFCKNHNRNTVSLGPYCATLEISPTSHNIKLTRDS